MKTDEVEALAERMLRWLLRERNAGRITPDKPITSADLCAAVKVLTNNSVVLDERKIREIMNYLRKHKKPVGSTTKGYFAILYFGEFDRPIEMLIAGVRDLEAQIKLMKEAREDMFKRENSLLKIQKEEVVHV